MILGLLAHVDAGKTTLSEALLYLSHASQHLGRVDHKDAFLDYEEQERERGITIFAKEAVFTWKDREFTLIDTPGHIDFSAQMERTLPILDVAVLVINGSDGVQAHSETIWRLLAEAGIPTVVFVNKMDLAAKRHGAVMQELKELLDEDCIDFSQGQTALQEAIAMCRDDLLERYLKEGGFHDQTIAQLVMTRQLFPCFFGSALKQTGVSALLDALVAYTKEKTYDDAFSARVYNITHDEAGNRLTHLKITGGTICAKQQLLGEKVDQIRRYHGRTYECVKQLDAGHVCAVKGLQHTVANELLTLTQAKQEQDLSAAMIYRLIPPASTDAFALIKQLDWLAAEEPSLHLHYDPHLKEIRLQINGDVQREVLQQQIKKRLHIDVEFAKGSIAYRETIAYPLEGVGHYEMIMHYAEVHLQLIPLKRNSGLQIDSDCPTTMIPAASQRMILHYLQSELLTGVLSNSPLTDMRIVLISGRVHDKHTSGNDLREAAMRALRQGLRRAKCLLLEPSVRFRLTIPKQVLSRAMYDLEGMQAKIDPPIEKMTCFHINGYAPLSAIRMYPLTLRSYTKGEGSLYMSVVGYQEVIHPDKVLREIAYDCDADSEHVSGSVFLLQKEAVYITYDRVFDYMHVKALHDDTQQMLQTHTVHRQITIDENEVKRVTAQLHQPRKKWRQRTSNAVEKSPKQAASAVVKRKIPCLIVDGYNMIFTWPHLKDMAQDAMDSARSALVAMLAGYHGYQKGELIIVFDAYRNASPRERIYKDHSVYIVYTKQAQTADAYIEKATHEMASEYQITVATSDAQEQNVILAQGAMRLSAMELYDKLQAQRHSAMLRDKQQPQFRNMPLSSLRVLNQDEHEDL